MRRVLILLALSFILLAPVSALGISPPSHSFEFEPNGTIEGNCDDIVHSPACVCIKVEGETDVRLFVYGDLDYAFSNFTYEKDVSGWQCYSYNITFPEKADKGGQNLAKVVVSGLAATGFIKAEINVDQKVHIEVDPKYAKDYVPPPPKPFDINKLLVYGSILIISILLLLVLKKNKKERKRKK